MLDIKNLNVYVIDENEGLKPILRDLNLHIKPGEVHVIMGPNGSGKSTLANVLAGRPDYQITSGRITFKGEDLIALAPEERAERGIFLAFQYPTEMPGVNNMYFLRTALNGLRKRQGLAPYDAADFLLLAKTKIKEVGLDDSFLYRAVNEGFSGGEKKRNEILQMLLFTPQFIILDETDSGLDIDALHMVGRSVDTLRHKDNSILVITHYQRLLDYIKPDIVHVMVNGTILKTGDQALAKALDAKGYGWLANEANA